MTGLLASGELLDTRFNRRGAITLVPEPTTLLLIALGPLGLTAPRRLNRSGFSGDSLS